MSTGDSNTTGADGGCIRHPFVQLRCRSRSGDWKTLLESCPLCVDDTDRSVGASVCSDASAPPGAADAAPKHPRGRERTASPAQRPSRGRSASRVRFPSAGKEAQRASLSVPPGGKGRAPKALKEPRYRACEVTMQRQLDENEKQNITFMSEDLNLEMSEDLNLDENLWNSGPNNSDDSGKTGDGSVLSGEIPVDSRQKLSGRHSRRPDHDNAEEKEEKKEDLMTMLSGKQEEEKDEMKKTQGSKMETKLRDSVQLQTSRILLPEDFQAEERSFGSRRDDRGCDRPSPGSAGGKSSSRSRSHSRNRQPSDDAPSQRGRSLSLRPRPAAKVGPDPEEFPCHSPAAAAPSWGVRRVPPPPPPARQPRRQAPAGDATSPPAFQRMPVLSYAEQTAGDGPSPPWQELIVPPGGADEVSLLSFPSSYATNSVTAGSTDNSRVSRHRHNQGDLEEDPREDMEEEDDDLSREGEVTDPASTLINTANYDAKGRCVHHPHVRLRKKKMLGRGWKTLMSACPDCCMEELRRVVDDKKQELVMKKLERSMRNKPSFDRSHRSEDSGDRGGHNGACSVGSAPMGVTNSDGTTPGSWHPSPHSASLPLQPALAAHLCRAPSQESFRSAPVPPKALTRSQSKRPPPQDTCRSAPTSQRLPSEGSFRNGTDTSDANDNMQRQKAHVIVPSDRSISTASLTVGEELSGSVNSGSDPSTKIVPLRSPAPTQKTRSRGRSRSSRFKSSDQSPARRYGDASDGGGRSAAARCPSVTRWLRRLSSSSVATPPVAQPVTAERRDIDVTAVPESGVQVDIIHVRDMKWADAEGSSARYTGQVNAQFVPHGHGSAVFDGSNKTKQGEWKDGKLLRSSRADKNSNGGGPPYTPRSRSRSRAGQESRRERSRGRSASRVAVRHRSVSKQPRPLVAVRS